jgi:hypothetical protein
MRSALLGIAGRVLLSFFVSSFPAFALLPMLRPCSLAPCLGRRHPPARRAPRGCCIARLARCRILFDRPRPPPRPCWANFISSRGLCFLFRPGLPRRYRAVCHSRANHHVTSMRHPSLVAILSSRVDAIAFPSCSHRAWHRAPQLCAWDSHCSELLIARLVQPPSLIEAGPTRPTIANYRT